MQELLETAMQVASTTATVLLLGETGTGKELIARAIHECSGRGGGFVAVNCGAIPEALIESELFGHVDGAYTGAKGARPGLFRHAHEGTLLLDEVGDMPAQAQASTLRVLQERQVRPVGGLSEVPVNVRVIAATSVPLEQAVQDGTFREDLFYRLNVICLRIPPLRDRTEDIEPLFRLFCQAACDQHGRSFPLHRARVPRGAACVRLAGQRAAAAELLRASGADLRGRSYLRRLLVRRLPRQRRAVRAGQGPAQRRTPDSA